MISIDREAAGAVMRIRLSRSEKKNALTDGMQRSIAEALADADRDPAVRAVVIMAEGRDFCAGNDLGLIEDMAAGRLRIEDSAVDAFLGGLSGLSKPLLAGVRGRAIGVGATLLLHCDVVVAAEDARITFPFVDLGLVPEAASTHLLPARIGYARAYALMGLGEPVSGAQAAGMGLVTYCVPDGEVDTELSRLAERLVAKPAAALAALKKLLKDRAAIADALARDQAIFMEQLRALRPAVAAEPAH